MSYGYSVSNLLLQLSPASITYELSGTPFVPAVNGSAQLQDNRMDSVVIFPGPQDLGSDNLDIDIDFGAAVALQGFAILNHNFAKDAGCSCTVIASNSSVYASPTTAKAATPLTTVAMKDKDHVLQFPSLSRRYWKLRFDNGDVLTPYIGEVFAFGSPVVLPRSSIWGSGESPQMFGASMDFGNGNVSSYFLGGPRRQKDYSFADLSASELAAYQSLWLSQKGGFGPPFLWIEDIESSSSAATAAAQECVFGRFLVPTYGYQQDDFGVFQPGGQFTIRSLGREVGS